MQQSWHKRQKPLDNTADKRLKFWYGALIFILVVFALRLFYLQIIRHDYYRAKAQASQLKEYSIPAQRGIIKAHEHGAVVPLVLNQRLYTLYADPVFLKNAGSASIRLAPITNGSAVEYAKLMKTRGTRYVVLAKRLTEQQKKQVDALKIAGVGTQALDYRTYPQGSLAAQMLGFVDNDGAGRYGIEQALNAQMAGTPGELKAITDASGVPLVASRDNTLTNPKNGDDIVLTVDLSMQKQLENLLQAGLKRSKSSSGSAVVMDPNTGAIKAMANWPTYDPGQYFDTKDASVFNNAAVSSPLEVGSIMKSLTTAAALDLGVVKPNTTYNDPGRWQLDGHSVTNIEEVGGPGQHSIEDIIYYSINTGATWMLMQMGGQTGVVNQKARDTWHDYMVNHYQFGKKTGVEQGYESPGYIPDPDKGDGLQLAYANTSFGQAMTATPLQMAAAFSSAINGGTYYKPYLVDGVVDSSGIAKTNKPTVVRRNVVSAQTSQNLQSLLEEATVKHYQNGFSFLNFSSAYNVGAKSGTPQIANPSGGYYSDRFNGTSVGFVGGDKPQYVIMVRVNEPHIGGYAGATSGLPLFSDIAHMLINNFDVIPKSN